MTNGTTTNGTTTNGRTRTASWAEFAAQAPELAERVRACFAVRKHCTMATLRSDGAPRISGTEVQLGDEQLEIGSMPRALKLRDLLRDPRCALHSPTVDPPEGDESSWSGEAKVAGLAALVEGSAEEGGRLRVALTEVVHTRVDGDALVVTSWHPGRGVEERRR